MKWFKFYGQDWLTDPKIIKMRTEDRLCLITLFCLASSENNNGIIKNCDEDILIQLTHLDNNYYDHDNEIKRAKGCLKRYEALQIVTLGHNGDVTLCNFNARQEQNLCNAERQKNYRERLKTKVLPRNDSNVTQRNDSNVRREESRIDKKREGESSLKFLISLKEEMLKEFSQEYQCSRSQIENKAEDLYNYCKAKNKVYKNYKSFLRNALSKDFGKRQKSTL